MIQDALCVLSQIDTNNDDWGFFFKSDMYCFFLSNHGGFGITLVSVQSSTIFATLFPNFFLINLSVFSPPWSSTASCKRPAIASSVSPPFSMTWLLTDDKWKK